MLTAAVTVQGRTMTELVDAANAKFNAFFGGPAMWAAIDGAAEEDARIQSVDGRSMYDSVGFTATFRARSTQT